MLDLCSALATVLKLSGTAMNGVDSKSGHSKTETELREAGFVEAVTGGMWVAISDDDQGVTE